MLNSSRDVVDGPDFICVGMPKAGTGWLFDHLHCHPDFWMPPVKEMLYLRGKWPHIPIEGERGGIGIKLLEEGLRPDRRAKPHEGSRDRNVDLAFVEEAKLCNSAPRDLDRYAALFRFKRGRLSGDISPVYADLDENAIAQVADRFPNTKLLLMVRDPVARAWSRINMMPDRKFDQAMLQDADRFRNFLKTSPHIRDFSYPVGVVKRWRSHAPGLSLRHFLLDDVVAEPEKTRAEIWAYLGADPNKKTDLPADYNRKRKGGKSARPEITEMARAVLVDFFRDEILAGAAVFGGRASAWPAKYGL